FSWYFLGHSQHDFLELIQVADLTGAYGVSFLVAAVNALLFEVLWARAWFRDLFGAGDAPAGRRIALLAQAPAVGGLLLAGLFYGQHCLSQEHFTPGPFVALLQGSVPQAVRNDTSADDEATRKKAMEEMAQHYLRLARIAAKHRPDVIVWP